MPSLETEEVLPPPFKAVGVKCIAFSSDAVFQTLFHAGPFPGWLAVLREFLRVHNNDSGNHILSVLIQETGDRGGEPAQSWYQVEFSDIVKNFGVCAHGGTVPPAAAVTDEPMMSSH